MHQIITVFVPYTNILNVSGLAAIVDIINGQDFTYVSKLKLGNQN